MAKTKVNWDDVIKFYFDFRYNYTQKLYINLYTVCKERKLINVIVVVLCVNTFLINMLSRYTNLYKLVYYKCEIILRFYSLRLKTVFYCLVVWVCVCVRFQHDWAPPANLHNLMLHSGVGSATWRLKLFYALLRKEKSIINVSAVATVKLG